MLGGRDGELFKEMEDLFFYGQLRHQGLSRMTRREVSDKLPLAEVPQLMRALGFYPSERDIQVCTVLADNCLPTVVFECY